MQTTDYTITQHDAKMIKELISFLGEDVFDQRRGEGAMGKSEGFLAKIRNVRGVLEQIGAYDFDHEAQDDEPPYTFWWEGPFDLAAKEVEYPLAKMVEGQPDVVFKKVLVNSAMPSGHFGNLQLAWDEEAGRICTLVSIPMAWAELFLGPDWHDIDEDLETTIQTIVNAIEQHPSWIGYHESRA